MRCVAIRGTPSTLVEPRASCRAQRSPIITPWRRRAAVCSDRIHAV